MANPNLDAEQLAKVVQSIPDGLVVVDLDWKVILCNRAAAKITGWAMDDLPGRKLSDCVKFVREQDREENYQAIKEAISTKETTQQKGSTLLLSKNGQELPISYSASPLLNREGNVEGAIIVFRDLTLVNDAFRMKSDFTYLQHQLRTPLSESMWNLEALLGSTKEEKTKEVLSNVLNSLASIRLLSNRLIEVSKIDQGLVAPVEKEISLDQIVNQSISSLSKLSTSKQIEIVVTSEILATRIKTDEKICSQILEELLKNALQYSDSGKKVEIKISSSENGILFEIKDQGMGLSLEDQPMVFTKFFRKSNLTLTVPGAGLGLYITLRYAKLLKGKIWFTSKENEGSTFSFFLPTSVAENTK